MVGVHSMHIAVAIQMKRQTLGRSVRMPVLRIATVWHMLGNLVMITATCLTQLCCQIHLTLWVCEHWTRQLDTRMPLATRELVYHVIRWSSLVASLSYISATIILHLSHYTLIEFISTL